jgi:hypothetical protein
MTKGAQKKLQELYILDRPYYGYSIQEFIKLKDKLHDYKECTTCKRMKEFSNYKSEYSGKYVKSCHFCQNRNYHKWRIDSNIPKYLGGLFDTQMLIDMNNHVVKNFRDINVDESVKQLSDNVFYSKRLENYDYKDIKMEEINTVDQYIKCSNCKCKYHNNDENISIDFGYNRLGKRFKTCTKCKRKRQELKIKKKY